MANSVNESHNKLALIIFLSVIIISSCALYFGVLMKQMHAHNLQSLKVDGLFLQKPMEIGDFQMTDTTGNAFANTNLKGKWTMMFFGFTNCATVCPTTLAALNKMYTSLTTEVTENKLPQVVMVSVDPERDSISRMRDYVKAFNPNFIGLRADELATERLEKELHIVAVKMVAEGKEKNHYTMNHSAEIILFNPQGMVQAFFSYPHDPEQLRKDYRAILLATEG